MFQISRIDCRTEFGVPPPSSRLFEDVQVVYMTIE